MMGPGTMIGTGMMSSGRAGMPCGEGWMGSCMPSFGPIFTLEETWALVDYLWTFVFYSEPQ
jgi:hypothetical protein